MSRHKLVKNIDLDNELDSFDGGEDYNYDGIDQANGGLEGDSQISKSETPFYSFITYKSYLQNSAKKTKVNPPRSCPHSHVNTDPDINVQNRTNESRHDIRAGSNRNKYPWDYGLPHTRCFMALLL